jgi:CDP-glycerol glycerophosphotransferase (TagB/SpsB family)
MIKELTSNKFTRRLLLIFTFLLSKINAIVPKNKYKILFYDSNLDFLGDNTEALYTYLKENNFEQKYKLICFVPNEKRIAKNPNYSSVHLLQAIFSYLTSKYVFFSFGGFRIKPSKDQIVVNLWHGTPAKTIGKLTKYNIYCEENLCDFTFLAASSEMVKPIMANAFGCSESMVKVIGHPRNDYLFYNTYILTKLGIDSKYDKKILWMPTFRTTKNSRFHDGNTKETQTMLPVINSYSQMNLLDLFLKENNILLVIKAHNDSVIANIQNESSNIKYIYNEDIVKENIKLYEFVKDFDALLTDYSSIYFDWLLLDRPIGFTLDDYDEYASTRGFVCENMIDYFPGHQIYNMDDFIEFLTELKGENDIYAAKRKQVRDLFCQYVDNMNCKRVLDMLDIKL